MLVLTSLSMCEPQVNDGIIPEIISWIMGRSSSWNERLKDIFVCQTLSTKSRNWREILKYAEREVKAAYPDPDMISKIERKVITLLKRSPREDFLKAKAYEWLKYTCSNSPNGFSPHEVALTHKIFQLRGHRETFQKYLDHPSRKNKLLNSGAPVYTKCCSEDVVYTGVPEFKSLFFLDLPQGRTSF